jgi:hypothetical protein
MFGGKELNGDSLLSSYRIKAGSTIHAAYPGMGGVYSQDLGISLPPMEVPLPPFSTLLR